MAEASIGHNSVAGDQLLSIIQRIERLNEEKKAIADDIKGIYAEAKSNGFDTKAMRTIVRLRAIEREKLEADREAVQVYAHAIGEEWLV